MPRKLAQVQNSALSRCGMKGLRGGKKISRGESFRVDWGKRETQARLICSAPQQPEEKGKVPKEKWFLRRVEGEEPARGLHNWQVKGRRKKHPQEGEETRKSALTLRATDRRKRII